VLSDAEVGGWAIWTLNVDEPPEGLMVKLALAVALSLLPDRKALARRVPLWVRVMGAA
jgi:hypothetical protein